MLQGRNSILPLVKGAGGIPPSAFHKKGKNHFSIFRIGQRQ